ncbi:MAG TPA: hypothetical protein VGJ84_12760 [Polyangiaceae bacterium]
MSVLLAFVAAIPASAGERPRIALVRDPQAEEPATPRLRAELQTLGLEVVEVALSAGQSPATSLDDAARSVGAFAAVRVATSAGGIEVWIADRVTGKTLLRELVISPTQVVDEVVALQAVELLRASLMELEMPQAPRGEVHAPPAVKQLAVSASRRSRFSIQLGLGAILSPGGVPPVFALHPELRFSPVRWLCIAGFAVVPVAAATVEETEGSADIRPYLFGAGADIPLSAEASIFQPQLGVGAFVTYLYIKGAASAPLAERADPLVLGGPYLRATLLVQLSRRVRVGGDGLGGIAIPRADLLFNQRRVASWGQPLVETRAVLELAID